VPDEGYICLQAQGVIASLSVHGSGDRPSWSGSHGKCHSLLFVPLSDTLSIECQIPCQPSDKRAVTRHYEEYIMPVMGGVVVTSFA